MAGFILIHGAWHGGWCFDPVSQLLRQRGHKVIAPDLPGMGGDAEALRAVTLAGWAEFTVELCHALKRELGDEKLVLAGHSRGGLVLSAAGSRVNAVSAPSPSQPASIGAPSRKPSKVVASVKPSVDTEKAMPHGYFDTFCGLPAPYQR